MIRYEYNGSDTHIGLLDHYHDKPDGFWDAGGSSLFISCVRPDVHLCVCNVFTLLRVDHCSSASSAYWPALSVLSVQGLEGPQ